MANRAVKQKTLLTRKTIALSRLQHRVFARRCPVAMMAGARDGKLIGA